ncbi:MAG TPA: metallophosphoesterase [Nitrospirales bacterium]|nr:metallophosphoesterase [Nitrospirales bacterium]
MRIAAVADLHCPRTRDTELHGLLAEMAEAADVLLLCGDLTDYGRPDEARILAKEIGAARGLPVLAVLGNHDYECGHPDEVERILSDVGVTVLNGTPAEVRGIGFVGVKGFAGGYDDRALQPWGEEVMKRFVHEAVDEALKLESALAKVQTRQRVVLLHYAPVAATVQGEPPEIIPFLGSSRLEEPLNRYPVTAVFHGHAHHGSPAGKTKTGVPVFNVALPLMRQHFPDMPFRVFEVHTEHEHSTSTI